VVGVLKDERLQLRGQPLTLIEDALVMDGSRGALDSDVGAEVKVELEGMSTSRLHKRARERIVVPVTLAGVGEEADVVALTGDHNSELGKLLAAELLEALLHVAHLLFKDSGVLTVKC
jgi:hypothetical protein